MYAPVGSARVELILAVVAGVGQVANTLVCVDEINTGATVAARVDSTVVHIGLTVSSSVAGQALTCVAVQSIQALSTVLTWVASTLVYVVLTPLACAGNSVTVLRIVHYKG